MSSFRAFADPALGLAGPVRHYPRQPGASLADLLELVELPHPALRPMLRVKLNGELIEDAGLYRMIRPKGDCHVTVVLAVAGGNGGAGKVLSTVAAIALIGASLFVGGGGLAFLGAAFAQGGFGASLLSAGLSLGASLLLQGLAVPTAAARNETIEAVGSASAQNAFEPGAYLQRVIGTRRVAPQMIMPPWTYFSGNDAYVVAAFGLAGAHQIEGIRIGSTAVEDDANITLITREGFDDDTAITDPEFTQTVIEIPVGVAMSDFLTKADEEAGTALDTDAPVYLPQWHRLESKDAPDEIVVNLLLPGGLYNLSPDDPDLDADIAAVTALRMRFRAVGASSWVNLPEFVLRGRRGQDAIRLAIRLVFLASADIPSVDAFSPNYRGFSWRYNSVTDTMSGWTANVYFNGTKIDWSDSQHLTVYLNVANFPKDRYEIEMIRGATVHDYIFNSTTHVLGLGGEPFTLNSFFSYEDNTTTYDLVRGINRYVRAINIVSIQSIYDEAPFDFSAQPTTVIAMVARNRSIEQVSCLASGYVADWDGDEWVADQISANPASWYREVLTGALNAEPVSATLIDAANLVDWHEWCDERGHAVHAVLQGQPVSECLSIIAQAGFARPRHAALHGVVIDRPRSPVGLITQRNAGGFGFEKPFARLPHALRVTYADAEQDYAVRETTVYADGYNADGSGDLIEASRFDAINYAGITRASRIEMRAKRDLRFARHRSRLIGCTMDIEHLEFQLGDLVLLETDILGQVGGRGRVKSIVAGGGLVTGLVLDEQRDFTAADAAEATRAVALRLTDGSIVTHAVTADDSNLSVVSFATPFAMPTDGGADMIVPGTLVATGTLGQEARSVLIWDMAPGPDLTAQITALDYAEAEMYPSGSEGDYPPATMTAEAFTYLTVDLIGYSSDPEAGDISDEMLPGETVLGIAMFVATGWVQMGFAGDIQTLVAPLELWVDGVNHGVGSTSLSSGNTIKLWTSGIVFEDAEDYELQLRIV